MTKDYLLNLLCRVYVQEISADEVYDELEDLIDRIKRLEEFANRFLNYDDLGWAIGKHDRDEAREALGKERVESK